MSEKQKSPSNYLQADMRGFNVTSAGSINVIIHIPSEFQYPIYSAQKPFLGDLGVSLGKAPRVDASPVRPIVGTVRRKGTLVPLRYADPLGEKA